MSTDLYLIRVLSKAEDHLVLRVVTGFAGGRNDHACTRSFALSVLVEARSRFNDNDMRAREISKGVRFRKATRVPAIETEARKWPSGWSTSEEFFRKNVAAYIAETSIRARKNKGSSDRFSDEDHEAYQALQDERLPLDEHEEGLCETLHFIELDVHATDARWLDGIEAGWVFNTTCYDVWYKDPLCPKAPASTKVRKKTSTKEGAPSKARARTTALEPGARVLVKHLSGGVRAVLMERRRATIEGTLAKLYESHEFALLTTDDGKILWGNIPNIRVVARVDAYEEGYADPEAFWARLMTLPMIERAREVARALGPLDGFNASSNKGSPSYPGGSRRAAGFLSKLSIERAALVISAAFSTAQRSSTFSRSHTFEKSARDFDSSAWRPFVGARRIVFEPKYSLQNLVGGFAWRVAHESEASNKAPAKLVSKDAIEALKQVPEADGWLKLLARTKPVCGETIRGTEGQFGLPGYVLE